VSVARSQHEVKVLGILAEDFISRPRPWPWDPRPRPRPLLFVLEAPRGRGQVLEDTSLWKGDIFQQHIDTQSMWCRQYHRFTC